MNLFDKVSKFANGAVIVTQWLGSGGKAVAASQAQKRADICNECPRNNQTVRAAGLIAEKIKAQLEIKNGLSMRVSGEKRLGTCDVCMCHLRLKVWIPIERIMPQPGDEFPDSCWINHESNERNNTILQR